MGAVTKIQWCHHTQNFWVGCTKVSAACDFCYAEKWANRAGRPELWQGDRQRTTKHNWLEPYKWNRAAAKAGERHRVFVNSLSDFFDNQADPDWRSDAIKVIKQCEHLDWLLLTKRPQNIKKLAAGRPPSNVWLGTTVENQEEANRRIPHLLAAPAAVHYLSMEPLLGPVRLRETLSDDWLASGLSGERQGVSWVIIGGESGAADKVRPFDTAWARDIIGQCRTAGVPVFVKQMGAHVVHNGKRLHLTDKKGGDPAEWPEELRIREFPKTKVPA